MHDLIRPVRPDDAAAIAAIYNPYVTGSNATFETESVTAAEMRCRVEDIAAQCPYLVHETGGEVDAYCYAHPWKQRAAYSATWETTVYVAPARHGQGIATRLMAELIVRCRDLGCHALVACITADNERSIAFHERLGFRRVSLFREVGRKFDRWLDVADLQLLLD